MGWVDLGYQIYGEMFLCLKENIADLCERRCSCEENDVMVSLKRREV